MSPSQVSRTGILRFLIPLGFSLAMGGCMSVDPLGYASPVAQYQPDPAIVAMYSAVDDNGYLVPAIDVRHIDPRYVRQVVAKPAGLPDEPGTIVVDPANRFLYLVMENGQALRYGIGVGREGFAWSGSANIKRKQQWPTWTPPAEMVARDPKAAPYAQGMPGGLDNPLGARAMYLYEGDSDTLYRIHGTNDPPSIGHALSSGCIRLFNQDVIDLYGRVPVGTKVIVLPSDGATVS